MHLCCSNYLGAPEDCATGIYYTAIPQSILPLCDPFLQPLRPLSMLCRVQIHSNQTDMIDMNWFYTEGVTVGSGEQCPLLEEDTGVQLLNSTRHTVIKHWDPAEKTLTVTLTIDPLQEGEDVGRYWCQASLPGVTLSRTAAYCQRNAAGTAVFPFPCNTLFEESNVCVTQTPQTTPTMLLISSSLPLSSSQVTPYSSIATSAVSTTIQPSSLYTSISDFTRSSYFSSNSIVSSTQTLVTSSHIMMPSSSSHYDQSPTSTTIVSEPMSGSDERSSNDVLVMSIVFCTLSSIILLLTVITALSVIKCHRRIRHHSVPELQISEGMFSTRLHWFEM